MIIAALDIGSNSIHLVVVETDHEKPFRVVASAKMVVRLGRSAARDQRLSAAAMDRAIDCLKQFRRVAESHGARELIAVATSAVREAANRDQFITRAAEEAGVDIDLLSGIEEARLIALAVSVKYKQSNKQQSLVIDIGGGSTELALMKNGEPTTLISFKLGAVRLTEQYVKSDPIGEKQLRRLRSELREVVAHRAPEIEAAGIEACYGTSGTINALAALGLRRRLAAGNGRMARRRLEHSLTLDELRALNGELASYSLEERVREAGLNRQRAEIIVAGGQLLEALMERLKIDELVSCDWALREGVIIAHLARRVGRGAASPARLERDPSLRGALALARHCRADLKHASRVAYLSQQLFDELRPLHALGGEHRRLLAAAALLHDIGYFVSHTGHHKHSAYLIQNSDLTGFTSPEIAVIANVAYYHRGTLPKAKHEYYSELRVQDREVARKLAALLRLADALDRDHEGSVRGLSCEIGADKVRIVALCSREAETMRWRLEERADLFIEVFGREVELITTLNAADYEELVGN
ncbi:MAG TPA: Ppx/GppA phosphatase family protein [Blastocatellia bacterium]|jgi:exopolyphosphatase/guanosine-5'-triphosphate,3'-diphosphate pyrophosphatase|nr:Ppx/GppA phosphatase family protein [Blastocatellia bacterium]